MWPVYTAKAVLFIKIAGAALVVASGTALGLYCAGLESVRIKELLEFKKALLILSSEIEYMASPLPEAMANIAKRSEKPVSEIFSGFAAGISAGDDTAYRIWETALGKHKTRFHLTEEDFEALTAFGKTLGYLDKQMQLNAISFTLRYIDDKTTALMESRDGNKRMRRSLGALGGLLLAVLLW